MRGLLRNGYEPSLITLVSAPAFFALFLLILWFVYRKDSKRRYEQYSQIPFDTDELNSVQDR